MDLEVAIQPLSDDNEDVLCLQQHDYLALCRLPWSDYDGRDGERRSHMKKSGLFILSILQFVGCTLQKIIVLLICLPSDNVCVRSMKELQH